MCTDCVYESALALIYTELTRGIVAIGGISFPTEEPNTVRWQDLNEKMKERLKQQLLTTIATFVAIFAIAFLIRYLNDKSVTFSAFGISISNAVFPMFAKFLTSMESHKSEGSKQKSLYGKIALFRWANTAIVSPVLAFLCL